MSGIIIFIFIMILAHYLILNFLSSLIWIINTAITAWYCIYHYSDLHNLSNLFNVLYAYTSFIIKTYIRILLILHKILIIGYVNDINTIVNSDLNYTFPSIL